MWLKRERCISFVHVIDKFSLRDNSIEVESGNLLANKFSNMAPAMNRNGL